MTDPAIHALDTTTSELVGIAQAKEVTGVSTPRRLLHAGPPLALCDLPGPMRGAVLAALLFEGVAGDVDEAERSLDAGDLELIPCHHLGGVGAMAGVVSPSMAVVVTSGSSSTTTFSPVNEGLGRAMRFGTHDEPTIQRLRWLRDSLLPVLDRGVRSVSPIELTELQAEALRRGDECHNRNIAATAALLVRLAPGLIRSNSDAAASAEVLSWASANPHFFLPFSIAAAKAVASSAHGAGITADDGRRVVEEARSVCGGTSSRFLLAAQDFLGAPIGIDVYRVARSGAAPQVNTGVAHRRAGVGQIGAGVVRLPLAPFDDAAAFLDEQVIAGSAGRRQSADTS